MACLHTLSVSCVYVCFAVSFSSSAVSPALPGLDFGRFVPQSLLLAHSLLHSPMGGKDSSAIHLPYATSRTGRKRHAFHLNVFAVLWKKVISMCFIVGCWRMPLCDCWDHGVCLHCYVLHTRLHILRLLSVYTHNIFQTVLVCICVRRATHICATLHST